MPTNETITPAYRWQLIADACEAIRCNLSALDEAQQLDAAGDAAAKIAGYAIAATMCLGAVAQDRVAALCPAAADATAAHRDADDGADAEGKED
ncbi:MAG: hypothetical protein IJJ51_01010 [Kiritimatiellae bacterium]|nr:hypothetical protein [Kiritimatiellia bacterium]